MTRIPVTIITGFLGSGKTTLLNHILDKNNKRLAVIENEFAAAFGIENEILHQDKIHDIQNLYEFGMGCVCCSSSGELINALEEISIRNEHEPLENRIEHVILETTGLADPTPIFELITLGANRQGNDSIVKNYYINGIVTLIDTKHFNQNLASINTNYKNELLAQVLTTDSIILNKIDLVDTVTLQNAKDWIQQRNSHAKIFTASFSNVPINEAIFDLRSEHNVQESMDTIHKDATIEAKKIHDPSIEQTMVLVPGFVDLEKTKEFIHQTTSSGNIYRVKGVLALPTNPDIKYVIQGVNQDQLDITEHGAWLPEETKESRITFIGRNVLSHCQALENKFKSCVY